MKKLFGRKDNEYKFATPKPTKDTCPYCGFGFEKAPTRKKKCPECENYIFVSSGKLYTEDAKSVKDWLENFWVRQLGITQKMFDKTREELSGEFGFLASVNDTSWRILNIINTPKKSYYDRQLIYLAMADILKSEGKSTDEVLAQAHKMELLEGKAENEASAKKFREKLLEIKRLNKDLSVEMVVKVKTCNDELVCDECKKLSEMTFTIDEALKNMPIPHNCTNAKCRCTLGFELPDTH
ncbi:MAG: hypothetical protein JW866_03115 [Ignavibacteriales bacterium]|nr:hypothetical protein [Ignavibacteriales bacterium]